MTEPLGLEMLPAVAGDFDADDRDVEEQVVCYWGGSNLVAAEALVRRWRARGVRLLSRSRVDDRDWMEGYRRAARPVEVGQRFVVDPGEPQERTMDDDRWLLRLPARRAFGTGSHESTCLAVEMLETLDLEGRSMLDFGSGSGILSFVGLLLGASSVVGLERDVQAVVCSHQNALLNKLEPTFVAADPAVFARHAYFDVAVANMLPSELLPWLSTVLGRLRVGGHLVCSGAQEENLRSLEATLMGAGLEIVSRRSRSGWVALCCRRG